MDNHNKVLVLGATGGIGGEVARRLVKQGWTVTALTRRTPASDMRDGIIWKRGDAMNPQDVLDAAAGATWIVHAVNPPGYRDWEKLVLPMLDNTIAAARHTGASILLPGTVYNYGPDAFPLLDEQSPQHPQTKKGKLRAQMEQRLQKAATSGVQSLIVRAGDFFGPRVANSWFSQALIKPGQKINAITNPGQPGIGHQWAYLPDVAETMVQLMARRDQLAAFETFHMQGHWDPDGTRLAAAIARVTGNSSLKTKAFPWFLMPALALFKPTIKEMLELRYLWKTPLQMQNAKLVSVLGQEPHTPLDEAIRTTLAGLGCI